MVNIARSTFQARQEEVEGEATKDDLASFPIDRHHSDNRYDVEHAAGLGRLMWASTREVG